MFRAYFSRISRADQSNLASVPDVLIFTPGFSVGAAVVFAAGGRVSSSRLTAARSSNVTKERGLLIPRSNLVLKFVSSFGILRSIEFDAAIDCCAGFDASGELAFWARIELRSIAFLTARIDSPN